MALILHIDTALEKASVCLARDGKVIALSVNEEQKDHAAWIHPAIQDIFSSAGISLQHTDAIAISAGPGSYTGLRVGMSTAKGLCYALQLPLLSIGTLSLMTAAAIQNHTIPADSLLCPMIDARRMEVFTALYDTYNREVQPPHAMIIDGESFVPLLEKQPIWFFGNGSIKLQKVLSHPAARFPEVSYSAADMVEIAAAMYGNQAFASLAYAEPQYVKAFYTAARNS